MRRQLWMVLTVLASCGPPDRAQGEALSAAAGRELATQSAAQRRAEAWAQLSAALADGRGGAIFALARERSAEGSAGDGNLLVVVLGDSNDLCAQLSDAEPAGQTATGVQLALWLREVDPTGQPQTPTCGDYTIAAELPPSPADGAGGPGGPDEAQTPGRRAVMRLLGPSTALTQLAAGSARARRARPLVDPVSDPVGRAGCRPCAAALARRRPTPVAARAPTGRLHLDALQLPGSGEGGGGGDGLPPATLRGRLSLSSGDLQGGSFAHPVGASWCAALSEGLTVPPAPQAR